MKLFHNQFNFQKGKSKNEVKKWIDSALHLWCHYYYLKNLLGYFECQAIVSIFITDSNHVWYCLVAASFLKLLVMYFCHVHYNANILNIQKTYFFACYSLTVILHIPLLGDLLPRSTKQQCFCLKVLYDVFTNIYNSIIYTFHSCYIKKCRSFFTFES